MQDSRSCDPGSIPGGAVYLIVSDISVTGVVDSCKIPILATQVRFPGGAVYLIVSEISVTGVVESCKILRPGFESVCPLDIFP